MKRLLRLLDWFDDHVLRHRFYFVCRWLAQHPGWD